MNYGGVFMKLTYMQRLEAALKYKNGEGTYEQIAKEYGIKLSSMQEIASKILFTSFVNFLDTIFQRLRAK